MALWDLKWPMTTASTGLYEVLYVSTLAPQQPPGVVADIASHARAANAARQITGLLIFDGMRFCQQLEGYQNDVLALIERIRNDPRHIHVEILHHGPLAQRRFQQFSLAFSAVENEDTLARLERLDGVRALAVFTQVLETLDY